MDGSWNGTAVLPLANSATSRAFSRWNGPKRLARARVKAQSLLSLRVQRVELSRRQQILVRFGDDPNRVVARRKKERGRGPRCLIAHEDDEKPSESDGLEPRSKPNHGIPAALEGSGIGWDCMGGAAARSRLFTGALTAR
jgi:hypothetical protein